MAISSMVKTYSKAVSQVIAAQRQRYVRPASADEDSLTASPIVHHHFTVVNEATELQAPAWSEYVGRILDVPVSRAQFANGFTGEIDSYILKDMIYLDSRTDAVCQTRTWARISGDNVRDYVFHVAVEGIIETVTGSSWDKKSAQFVPGILALDMGQKMHMVRPTYARVLAFFLPRTMVEMEIPDAESIHGMVVAYTSPLTRLLLKQLLMLCRDLPAMEDLDAERAIHSCARLILAAFSKQIRLKKGVRAAERHAILEEVRRHVKEKLYQGSLSPESIRQEFQFSRPTLYRMFEAEGGLAEYIRNCRLREAANELVGSPKRPIVDIAYCLGFNSASDFSRAFRRSYGMTPWDFRHLRCDVRDFK